MSIIKSPAELPATPKTKGGPGVYDGLKGNDLPGRTPSRDGVPEKIIDNVGDTAVPNMIKTPAERVKR